jgi:hypothetical protein
MPKTKLLATATILLAVLLTMISSRFTSEAQNRSEPKAAQDPIATEIAGYRSWARINQQPVLNMIPINGAIDLSSLMD